MVDWVLAFANLESEMEKDAIEKAREKDGR